MPGQAIVRVNENEWAVSLAATYAELVWGLSGLTSIPSGTGMLFVLATDQPVSVTTQPLLFNIDIIFISGGLEVVDVARNVAPGNIVTESTPVRYFLEVNTGEADDIESGDMVGITIYQLAATTLNNWISPLVSFAGLMVVGAFMVSTVRGITKAILGESKGRERPKLLPQTELPQVLIEGGEPVPIQYGYLVGWISEPLPEYSLAVELLPAVEVVERKIDDVLKQLKDGVESIQQSEKFRLFLVTMSKFHDYSIGNQILIMIQKPDATHVAGFNTWKDLGRWVKKGEKGIAILAPIMPPRPTCPKCGAKLPKGARLCPQCGESVEIEEVIEVTPRYFKVVYIFDISQTEGKPLPEFEVPVLTGEANEELFAKVMVLVKSQGLDISFESRPYQDPSIKGQYFDKSIWVRPEETRAQQLKTLLHEVAHYYSEGVFRIPRRDAETIAESAAFSIGARFGFDSGIRSFPYVALWAKDKKVLEQNLAAIRKVATTIIAALAETVSVSPKVIPTGSPLLLPQIQASEPEGTCYEDAWRYIIKEQQGELVHGRVKTAFGWIHHAWVELPTGYVWEPQNKIYVTKEQFYSLLTPMVDERYSIEEASIMVARTKNFGPWSTFERAQFLKHKEPAVIPVEPRPRREEDLEYLADSPEFVAQTIADIGYRDKLDTAFQEAIARVKGLKQW